MARLKEIQLILLILGAILILHHGLAYGLWFDASDPIGHDWYGTILVLGSVVLEIWKRGGPES